MQLAKSPAVSKGKKAISLRCLRVLTLVLAAAVCGESNAFGKFKFKKNKKNEQMSLEAFKPKKIDYTRIVDEREKVSKHMAMVGHGLVDREGDPLNTYLNAVLKRIIAVSPVPGLPARAVVLDQQNSPVAYARLDGTIYIPFRLLAIMNDNPDIAHEDVLAFLLAHEFAHLLYYHFDLDNIGNVTEGVMSVIESGAAIIPKAQKLANVYQKAGIAHLLEESIFTPAFTRKQEKQADLLAFDLIVEAGYNFDAAFSFLDTLRLYEEAENEKETRRIEEMKAKEAQENPLDVIQKSGGITSLISKGFHEAKGQIRKDLERKHKKTENRYEDMTEYHERWEKEVAHSEELDLTSLGWDEDGDSEYLDDTGAEIIRTLFANYRAASEAEVAIEKGDLDEAKKLIDRSLSAPTKFSPYPRVVAALYHGRMGEEEQQMEQFLLALSGPRPSLKIYIQYLQFLDEEERLAVLDDAEQKWGRPLELLRLRTTILEKLGRKKEADVVRLVCFGETFLAKKDREKCSEPLEVEDVLNPDRASRGT